ncbi:MAG: YraN family protein [Tannerellaceae bacterium]|jgi:putative endonuclease|nr:YraN family protein [Tannerellaceae bacterium]
MTKPNLLGKEGEEEARKYLMKHGYTILAINWRWYRYELDIVAFKDGELIVVEVKTRSANYLVPPEEAVNYRKIRHLTAAGYAYARRFRTKDLHVRFDIITIIKDKDGYSISHIENAFCPPY